MFKRNAIRGLIMFCSVLAVSFAFFGTAEAGSITKYWIGSEGGNFSANTNWSTTSGGANNTTAPGANDAVIFDSGATTNATVNASTTVASITLTADYGKTITLATGVNLTLNTLNIGSGSIVKMGQNTKLTIAGNGTPLTGAGTLDTSTNVPNTVEYTGQGTTNITSVAPAASYNNLTVDPAGFSRNSALVMNAGQGNIDSAVKVAVNGYGYFGGYNSADVIKVRLSDMTVVGSLEAGLGGVVNGFTAGNYVYFATDSESAKMIKVDLSTFTVVGSVLDLGMQGANATLTDGTYAYIGMNTDPAKVLKVRLSDMSIVGTLTLQAGESNVQSGAGDAVNGFGYYAMYTNPLKIVKVKFSDLSRVGVLTLATGENGMNLNGDSDAEIDTTNGFGYFGTDDNSRTIAKVNLSTFTEVGSFALEPSEVSSGTISIDSANNIGYFSTRSSPLKVIKVRLSDMTRLDTLTMNTGEEWPNHAAILDNGYLYVGGWNTPGVLVRINLGSSTSNLGNNASIGGNLTIGANATLSAPNSISVAGNFSNLGTFTANTGTVTLSGADQTLSGNTTFYKLTKDVSADVARTLTFASGTTQTIGSGGILTLLGGLEKMLSLRSSVDGERWNLNVNDAATVVAGYLDVKDSDASLGKVVVTQTNSHNSDGNLNWSFPVAAVPVVSEIHGGGNVLRLLLLNAPPSLPSQSNVNQQQTQQTIIVRIKQQLIVLINQLIEMLTLQISQL